MISLKRLAISQKHFTISLKQFAISQKVFCYIHFLLFCLYRLFVNNPTLFIPTYSYDFYNFQFDQIQRYTLGTNIVFHPVISQVLGHDNTYDFQPVPES
jgi:hypothetical protein